MTKRATITTAALTLIVATVLAGCTPSDDEPGITPLEPSSSESTAAPTQTGVLEPLTFELPTSADQAIADAGTAAEAWALAVNYVEQHPEEVAALSQLAAGDALSSVQANIEAITTGTATVTGSSPFVAQSGTAEDLDYIEFGSVEIVGCTDARQFTVIGSNDSAPVVWPNDGVFQTVYTLEFRNDGNWIVVDDVATGLPCEL